jgi:P-type conjugative transfer ATPase TrbB
MAESQEIIDRRLKALRFALGPIIVEALSNPNVVEVMLNDDGSLFLEELGQMKYMGEFDAEDAMAVLNIVSSAIGEIGGEISIKAPYVEGVLPLNGERFTGLAPPVVERASFAIRKRALRVFKLDEYVRANVITFAQSELLRNAIAKKKNILVAGGTGSGKTTFVNALLAAHAEILPGQRMLLLQDVRELQCALKNKVMLMSTEWTSMQKLSELVNRLRPDSITVGEVRSGAPALALLKLWNTGHPGGFGTLHADSAYQALTRLAQLIQEVSMNPQRELIADAVGMIVYLERTAGGRKVREIIEVNGYEPGTNKFQVTTIH